MRCLFFVFFSRVFLLLSFFTSLLAENNAQQTSNKKNLSKSFANWPLELDWKMILPRRFRPIVATSMFSKGVHCHVPRWKYLNESIGISWNFAHHRAVLMLAKSPPNTATRKYFESSYKLFRKSKRLNIVFQKLKPFHFLGFLQSRLPHQKIQLQNTCKWDSIYSIKFSWWNHPSYLIT